MRRALYLFAVFLVLFELATYLTNDMILPGMMQVIKEYQATQNYVALSMDYYLFGNCASILFIGVLAEQFGKRRIILVGNLFFLFCIIAILFSPNIHIFMAWRFLSGVGLGVVSLAYALIHENFNDKSAVKLTALMGNITMLAPLAGPALGTIIVSFLSWRYVFVITALMSALSFFGLLIYTPGAPDRKGSEAIPPILFFKTYKTILFHPEFLRGTLLTAFLMLPIFIWISQAPNLILYKLHQNYFHYGIYQVVSLSGFGLSSIVMQFLAGKYPITQLIKMGIGFVMTGLVFSLVGFQHIDCVVIGMLIYNLGFGMANGCVTRLVMSTKDLPVGMISALFGFIRMMVAVVVIFIVNKIMHHYDYNLFSFTAMIFFFGVMGVLMVRPYIKLHQGHAWT